MNCCIHSTHSNIKNLSFKWFTFEKDLRTNFFFVVAVIIKTTKTEYNDTLLSEWFTDFNVPLYSHYNVIVFVSLPLKIKKYSGTMNAAAATAAKTENFIMNEIYTTQMLHSMH